MLSGLFLAALWSPAKKGLTSWLSGVLCFLMFCHFPKCVLVHIFIKGGLGSVPSSKIIFYRPFQSGPSFVDHFVIYFRVCLVCSLQPCGHLLGKD